MRAQISIALLLAVCAFFFKGGGESKKSRKHYGLSYHTACKDYIKTFTCMTACKSIGYQIFRLDFTCKCKCHELKTTTVLPFFKWRTNGTTRKWGRTSSPSLYNIAGTLSPRTYPDYEDIINNFTSPAINITQSESLNITTSSGENTTVSALNINETSLSTLESTSSSITTTPKTTTTKKLPPPV
ncbi:hypothetical protein HF086_013109 [Spodoptera exigua]|uniref:Uncharacterized protein n=1 Tax=Spodoptera exigua TaxID=7107 RepID=A0A922MAB7_SPOEX|nr:hypothetical protein HF086_013109 [Spodoptera exigua]